jgi:hypothetical protein
MTRPDAEQLIASRDDPRALRELYVERRAIRRPAIEVPPLGDEPIARSATSAVSPW